MHYRNKQTCKACDKEFAPSRWINSFCSTPCRMTFNNRRAKRGATLYDLIMADRFGDDRRKGKMAAAIDAQLAAWRAEDGRRETWGEVEAPRDPRPPAMLRNWRAENGRRARHKAARV